jgi:DNA-binding protein
VPTPEFVEKYGHWMRIYVSFLDDDPARLVWHGFFFLPGRVPPEVYAEAAEEDAFVVAYTEPNAEEQTGLQDPATAPDWPYIKVLHLSEHLKVISNEKADNQKILVKFSDGTYITVDRTTDAAKIELLDAVDGSRLLIDRKAGDKQVLIEDIQTDETTNSVLLDKTGVTISDIYDNEVRLQETGIKLTDAVNVASIESNGTHLKILAVKDIKVETEGAVQVTSGGDCEVSAPNTTITQPAGSPPGTVTIGNVPLPAKGFCSLPACAMTGVPQTSNSMPNV